MAMSPEKIKEEGSPWELNGEKEKEEIPASPFPLPGLPRHAAQVIHSHSLQFQHVFNAMVNNTFTKNCEREQSFLFQVVGYLFTAMRENKQTKYNSSTLISLTRKCLTNSRQCDGILTLVQIP